MFINNPAPPAASVDVTGPVVLDNADSQAPYGSTGIVAAISRLQGFDGSKYERLRVIADNASAQTALGAYLLAVGARGQYYNGATWDLAQGKNGSPQHELVIYGASYANSTAATANTALQIIAPASNTNGMIIWQLMFQSYNTAGYTSAIVLAKASAPASITDGDAIAVGQTVAAAASNYPCLIRVDRPVFVASGKGLYYWSTETESATIRGMLYTLL